MRLLRTQGYLPARLADYDPRHVLRVLVGYRNGDPSGPRRAFFFNGRRFVGDDAPGPSSGLRLVRSDKRSATLAYGVYASGDKACCPSGGRRRVRFELRDGALVPLGSVPPAWQRRATG